jgi:toxin ParE1/3/4
MPDNNAIHFFPKAEDDLYDVWHYIAIVKKNPINAARFVNRLFLVLNKLAAAPEIGILKEEFAKGLRQFPFENFLIFYLTNNNRIEVVRILYGKRNVKALF